MHILFLSQSKSLRIRYRNAKAVKIFVLDDDVMNFGTCLQNQSNTLFLAQNLL